VVELGCGCGLVGLCFAACGGHVLLTDLPEPLVRVSVAFLPEPYHAVYIYISRDMQIGKHLPTTTMLSTKALSCQCCM